jgi:hypothetical protein
VASKYATGVRSPPGDIGASFMPKRGFYSSANRSVVVEQFSELKRSGVEVIAVSWWGPKSRPASRDGEGYSSDQRIPMILDAALQVGVWVCFHLEPYEGRSVLTVREDLEYIYAEYSTHKAFYRDPLRNGKSLFYIYDSYRIAQNEWSKLFSNVMHVF